MIKKEIIEYVMKSKDMPMEEFITKLSDDDIHQRDDLNLILNLKTLLLLDSIDKSL